MRVVGMSLEMIGDGEDPKKVRNVPVSVHSFLQIGKAVISFCTTILLLFQSFYQVILRLEGALLGLHGALVCIIWLWSLISSEDCRTYRKPRHLLPRWKLFALCSIPSNTLCHRRYDPQKKKMRKVAASLIKMARYYAASPQLVSLPPTDIQSNFILLTLFSIISAALLAV